MFKRKGLYPMKILHKSNNIEIREYPPIRRTIRVRFYDDDCVNKLLAEQSFYLWFPYQLFAWKTQQNEGCQDIHRLYVALSDTPGTPKHSKLILPPLSNVFDDYEVCLGDENTTLTSAEKAINCFWQSVFTEFQHCIWATIDRLWTAMRQNVNRLGDKPVVCLRSNTKQKDTCEICEMCAKCFPAKKCYEQWQQMSLKQITTVMKEMTPGNDLRLRNLLWGIT
jgi:hypothetical protein